MTEPLTQADALKILERYESDVRRLAKLAPSHAIVLLDNREGFGQALIEGLGLADKITLLPDGFMVMAVPDVIVHALMESAETPVESRSFFRMVPAARIVLIARGRTAIAGLNPEPLVSGLSNVGKSRLPC